MSGEISSKFKKSYPLLMHQDGERNSFSSFGFETGAGWFPLLFEFLGLCDDLQAKTGKEVGISQIKEKFGTLRLYCNLPCDDQEQHVLETLFEYKSSKICDLCGSPGSLGQISGYWCTRCDEHKATKDFRQMEAIQKKTIEEFLSYERQGIDCQGIVLAEGQKLDEENNLGRLTIYYPPGRLTSLKDQNLLEQMVVKKFEDHTEKLFEKVGQIKKEGFSLLAWSDGSEVGRQIFEGRKN